MKLTNSEIRKQAREALEGNWGKAILATLITFLITDSVPTIFSFVNPQNLWPNLWMLLCLPLHWGLLVYFLRILRREDLGLGHLFDGYNDFKRIFLTQLLVSVYTILWSLLLIIPGFIKALSYGLTPFILRDRPELSYNAAIEESMRLMEGNKMKLFLLYLSFIGWAILCILTLGFGFLILMPYIYSSLATFYQERIKEDQAEVVTVTEEAVITE
ncbi:MAG: DUF975 family protein [Bacteroidaceae bacterium]|nr:DUF975 family protein [Bacteroidaceae bacterium]